MASISDGECSQVYGSIGASILCTRPAGAIPGAVCNGDSGGYLGGNSLSGNGRHFQYGVTSFRASSGCNANLPDGFAEVANYIDWMNSVM